MVFFTTNKASRQYDTRGFVTAACQLRYTLNLIPFQKKYFALWLGIREIAEGFSPDLLRHSWSNLKGYFVKIGRIRK